MKALISFLFLIVAGLGLILFSGCGKSEPKPASPPEAVDVPADGMRTVQLTGNDTMQYNLTEIRAKTGEKIRITFTNIGKMPKQAMAHNWVLLKPLSASELNTWAMAASMKPPLYLPDDLSPVLAHTQMLGPGETDTIEFSAPAAPGDYPYLCTFPGHYVIMKGKLIVE